jgi:PAS domain S-box-containing protein
MSELHEREKLLIVDDELANIKILSETLRKRYQIFTATTGQEALTIAARIQPDLVLLDIQMPGMDGFTVCRTLRANHPRNQPLIIFITALTGEEDESIGLELGAVDYITKPFRSAIVLQRVATHLELKRQREQQLRTVQESLRESEDRFRLFMDNSPTVAWIKDEEGHHVYLSRCYEQRFGVSIETWLGKTDAELWPQQLAEKFRATDLEVLATGQPTEFTETIRYADGRCTSWLTIKFPFCDTAGVRYVGGIGLDISQRKKAEDALQQARNELEQRVEERTAELANTMADLQASEERYRTVVEDQTELISRFLPDKSYTFVNEIFCRFFGKSQDELIGRKWLPQAVSEDCPIIETKLQQITPAFPTAIIANRVYDAFGTLRWMEFVNRGFFDEHGQLLEIQSVGRDITTRKQAEELLANINTQLEQQVAERTTELTMINTSLTREIGERLRIEQEILEQQQRLQEMAQEMAMAEDQERDRIAAELHDQVNQRLVLAKMRVEALGRKLASPALERTAEAICDLLAQTIEDTRSLTAQIRPPLLAGAGLEAALEWLGEELQEQYGMKVEVCDDHEPKVLEYGLRSFIFQAVRELLVNVVKHAGVSCARVGLKRDGEHLVITVTDEGRGFDPVAEQSRKARSGGFGLFSVRQKIEYLGGLFLIDSKPGTGTSVTIRILLTAPETSGNAADTLKILLVDDQSFVREGLRALIEGEPNMEVIAEAGTGRIAIAVARDHRPDIVVMDLNMVDINGIKATRTITTELAGVRVVAFSVEADRRFIVEALKAGASGYVLKDSPFAVLAAAIRAVAAGETYLGPRISEIIIREYLQRVPDGESLNHDTLTAREREVLQMIAAGKSSKEIAFALEVSSKTIDSQRHNIMNKLNLYSTAELTKYAIREGLTPLT